MEKIVWCSPHPNHYNTYHYENIAKIPGLELEVVYFEEKLSKYPWKSDFKSNLNVSYLKKGLLGVDWKFLLEAVKNDKTKFMVAGYNNRTMFIMLTIFMFINRAIYIVSDTPKPSLNNTSLFRVIRNFWMKSLYRKLTCYFVTGRPGVETLIKLGLRAEKIVNLPFPTNIDYFIPNKDYKVEDEITFLSSGRLDINHKGYDVAIEAFAKVKATNYKVKYRIAGEGPDRPEIEALIKKLGLTDNVELLGWLEPQELLNFYHSGNIFMHPSNRDPFPNAVLEAMACGLPVIGSDGAGSVIDRVQNGVTGFVHKAGDVISLTEKLNKILSLAPSDIKTMAKNSREVSEKWSVAYNVETIKKAFQL